MIDNPNPPLDPESVEIAVMFRQRDSRVLDHLVIVYGERLRKYITWESRRRWLSKEDIEDIVHDTFLQAYRKGADYDPSKKRIYPWLEMLAMYQVRTLEDKRKGLDNRSMDDFGDIPTAKHQTSITSDIATPSPAIEKLLQQLSVKRATVIRLHYYEDESISNIAKLLDITEGTVRSHLSLARSDLRRLRNYSQND